MCTGSAFVGVDNVSADGGSGGSTQISYITTTQIVTTTLFRPSSYAVYRNVTSDELITDTLYSTAVQTTTASRTTTGEKICPSSVEWQANVT